MLVFDIEADNLLNKVTVVHCICVYDTETETQERYRDVDAPPGFTAATGTLEDGLKRIAEGAVIGGHNVHGYDIPVLQKLYPGKLYPAGEVRDSIVESEMWYPANDMRAKDFLAEKKYGKWIDKKYFGRHSLAAWGERLKCPKDHYAEWCKENNLDPWACWRPEMEDYCMQDCITTAKLFEFLEHEFDYKAAAEAVRIENRVARILGRQEQWGVDFDVTGASQLYAKLAGKQQAIARELKDSYFEPFYLRNGPAVTPKRSLKYKDILRGDITEGAPYVKIKLTEFNPGSRQHIYKRLMALYGWKPTKFTPSGEPMVDETVLQALPMPPAKLLTEYLLLEKRLGQIAEGNQAWLKQEREGRIHGRVKQNGTRTTRASHVSPNMGQVPKVGKEYGAECRSLFGPSAGRVQVGSDLSGIEMRALGHYLAAYDGGTFAREAVEGDVHSLMMKAIGFNSRDITKTAEYAYIYGAGDPKLGEITLSDMTDEERAEVGKVSQRKLAALGRATREKLQKGLNGMEPLVNACHKAAERGWMRTLDNRRIAVPSKHSSLNTLLQAMGGVLAKQWMIELDDMLIEAGINPANTWYVDASFGAVQMLWVHDEVQLDVKQKEEDKVARIAEQAAVKAGEHFKLRVPVAAESKIGSNWRECH